MQSHRRSIKSNNLLNSMLNQMVLPPYKTWILS